MTSTGNWLLTQDSKLDTHAFYSVFGKTELLPDGRELGFIIGDRPQQYIAFPGLDKIQAVHPCLDI